jgi:hypothetical protein
MLLMIRKALLLSCVLVIGGRYIGHFNEEGEAMTEWKNKLYLGDNLDILRQYIPDESVDLIYLEGKNVEYPRLAPVATFKRAKKQNKNQEGQTRLV